MSDLRRISSGDLPQSAHHVLKEVFEKWELPEQFVSGLSSRWKCQISPFARTEEEIRFHALQGNPVLVDPSYAQQAFEQVGADALDYLIGDPQRNVFPRPKIAFVAGSWLIDKLPTKRQSGL